MAASSSTDIVPVTPVVRKRPAAAPSRSSEWLSTQAPGVHVGEASQDKDDGERDDRQTSRAQRWVFEQNKASLPAEIRERYDWLCDASNKCPGKQKDKNAIINSATSRASSWKDGLAVKSRTVAAFFRTRSKARTSTHPQATRAPS